MEEAGAVVVDGLAAAAAAEQATAAAAAAAAHGGMVDPTVAAAAAAAAAQEVAGKGFQAALVEDWWPWLVAHLTALGVFASQGRDDLHEALLASWVAAKAWWKVIVLFGHPVARLLHYLWTLALPYLQWFAQKSFDHLKEQEPEVLLAYAGFVAALVGLALLRRLLRRLRVYDRMRAAVQAKVAAAGRQYQRATDKLRSYSRRAAEALPHVLFALACLAVTWLRPQTVRGLAREYMFNIVLLYVPALFTFLALQHIDQKKEAKRVLQDWLPYWVVAAAVLAARAAVEQLWLRWLTKLVPWGAEAALFLALWLHVPSCGGAVLHRHLQPSLRRSLGGLLALQAKRDALIQRVLRVAVFARLLSQRTADRLAGHVDEVLLVLPAAVLTLSPLAAGWGLLFISLLYPAYATVRAMGDPGRGGGGSSTTPRKQGQGPAHGQGYDPTPCLRYWVVYALSHLAFQALPFWSVIQMWYFLWVLLPPLDLRLPIPLDGRGLIFGFLSNLYQGGQPQLLLQKAADERSRQQQQQQQQHVQQTQPALSPEGRDRTEEGAAPATATRRIAEETEAPSPKADKGPGIRRRNPQPHQQQQRQDPSSPRQGKHGDATD